MKDKLSDDMLALITDRPENCTAGVFGMISRRYAADSKLPGIRIQRFRVLRIRLSEREGFVAHL